MVDEMLKRMLGELGTLVIKNQNPKRSATIAIGVIKVASKYSWKVSPNFPRSIQEVATKYPRLVVDMS